DKSDTFTSPSFPLSPDDAYRPTGGRFSAHFALITYITFAYKLSLTPDQRQSLLSHLPKWVATDRFSIEAKAPTRNPTKDQMRLMMQSLLGDRFRLVAHFESQQTAVLTLTVIKPGQLGPALRLHSEGPPCDAPALPLRGNSNANRAPVFPPTCG